MDINPLESISPNLQTISILAGKMKLTPHKESSEHLQKSNQQTPVQEDVKLKTSELRLDVALFNQ